ncbi:MAG: hypothetical protein NTZ35_09900 [Ignavibacteriales bacterium]|nr:hypothetical protein [Ignavibacteriales bacterium]
MYAFVSAEHGITEVGYHGLQPVSKNSRTLVRESGVLTFSVRIDNKEYTLQTSDVDWRPTRIEAETILPDGICSLVIAAKGRTLVVRCSSSTEVTPTLCMRLDKQSTFTAVHGERTWSSLWSVGGKVVTGFRDRIMLQKWLDQTGPYAGDFLIPEPVRKKIFNTSKLSGLATRDDLRPEFQNTDLALYDAGAVITFGGVGCSLRETAEAWIFEQTMQPGRATQFTIRCSDQAEAPVAESEASPERPALSRLALPGFPHLEEFATTVPGLVESCIVRDCGIPRACPGRYYWIWAWDALVTMQEALRWGDHSNVLRTVRFIEQHRDEAGRIPARWTRALLPLDTPSPGGIEFLQAALVYEAFLETNDDDLLKQSLPSFIARFEDSEQQILREGLVKGEGFYPDLLSAFGRGEESAVCMEVGSWYALCRILENIARQIGDGKLEERTSAAAAMIAQNFSANYWDKEAGFFVDSINSDANTRSRFHPLFALLFLQSSLGLPLIRPHLQEAAAFIARELVTDAGMRVIPLTETGPSGEDVLDSWYPHWDLYALKLFRRAGNAGPIMRWLGRAEEALSRLGYCPEFLTLKGFRENDSRAWERHGSASNLNCVTSWLRGIRESIVGFEFDPGGITHLPLSLPVPAARLENIRWRGSSWSFESIYGGPHFESLVVNDTIIEGSTKIPIHHQTPGDHIVTALYGSKTPLLHFTEVANAKLLNSDRRRDVVEIVIEPLGFVDVAFFSPELPAVFVDNRKVFAEWHQTTGQGFFSLPAASRYTIRIQKA